MIDREPFSWVLIRPPWTSTGLCCKACVCEHMKLHDHGEVSEHKINMTCFLFDNVYRYRLHQFLTALEKC